MRKTRLSLWDEFNMDDGIQLAARDRFYSEHRQRLHRIRPSVNMNTPRNFPKLQGDKIGTFSHEQYQEITKNNQRLLKRLTNISHKKSRFTRMKQTKKAQRSLNKTKKKKEMDRIDRENRFLVSRIMNCRSTIDHKKINKDWNRHRNIIRNHSVSKQKRKSFRPNRLSPLSNTSSSSSTPMTSSRMNLSDLNLENIHNMSPNTLQKLIALQCPLDTITEKPDDTRSNISLNAPHRTQIQSNPMHPISFKDKLLNDALSQMSQLSFTDPTQQQNVLQSDLIFSRYMNQQTEDKKDTEPDEEDEVLDEVLSDWEHDEEWLQKETITKHKRKPTRKTITIGLPLI